MKKLLLISLFMLILCGCGPRRVFVGYVTEKDKTEAHTEIIPPGYRYDCSITIGGKFKCGVHYFITSKVKNHPAEYHLTLTDGTCTVRVPVDEQTWNDADRLDTYTTEIYGDSCQ